MGKVDVRKALEGDSRAIRALVRTARLNPMSLDWRRFIVAVTEEGQLVGCGQIKPHGDGIRELASIVVEPAYRGMGISRLIINRLMENSPMPLYLMCRSQLRSFYEKFDFHPISHGEMPLYFRRIASLANVFSLFSKQGESLLIMKHD